MSLFAGIDPAVVASGFGVGFLVGVTGVGGGSLMTPVLVLVFGINVSVAVGTDLLYAALTKAVGSVVHGRAGTLDWRIVRRLGAGSIPAAIATIGVLYFVGAKNSGVSAVITGVLGVALIVTAVCALSRQWLARLTESRFPAGLSQRGPGPTIAVGVALGVLVSISSVGAGAIGMTALVFLYPKLPTVRLVGADIAHAVPLTLVAGIGHWFLGTVDWPLLGTLLLGSIPGISLGSHLAGRIPDQVLRPILAVMLALLGIKMLA